MRYLLALILATTFSGSAFAEEFHLTDASGVKHGPYTYGHGKVLDIQGQLFELSITDPVAHAIIQKMKRIIIPEVEYRAANVHDVFENIEEQASAFDRDAGGHHISFVLNLGDMYERPGMIDDPFAQAADPFAAAGPSADPFATPVDEPAPRVAKKPSGRFSVPLVTFRATHVSIHDVVSIVCEVSNLEWEVKDGVVVVTPKVKKKAEAKKEPPRKVMSPGPSPQVLMKAYTVEDGDDLFAIAMMWGVSVSKLRAANALTSKAKLKVGQKILIPLSE